MIKLQKRAIRILNKAGYGNSTNHFGFTESSTFEFVDIVYFTTRWNNVSGWESKPSRL